MPIQFPTTDAPRTPARPADAPAGATTTIAVPTAAPAPVTHTQFVGAPPEGPTDLEGAGRTGYVAPNKVESPFSPDERAALSKKIPCPALASMFNAGMLKVAQDGTVEIPDLERALSQIGPSKTVRGILERGADNTDDLKGSFNLFNLNGSKLDHTGSTGIRQNGVHPERFETLKSFSRDGVRLTAKDLADAAEHFTKSELGDDPSLKEKLQSLRGRLTQQAEMVIGLETFGQVDKTTGERFFTFKDAEEFFVEGRIPSTWEPPAVPVTMTLPDVLRGTALGLFRQLINGQ